MVPKGENNSNGQWREGTRNYCSKENILNKSNVANFKAKCSGVSVPHSDLWGRSNLRKQDLRVGAWNVRNVFQTFSNGEGSLYNTGNEENVYRYSFLDKGETEWNGARLSGLLCW